jgi:ribose transport system ATP-binding protein|tara:strand:- start:3684 stop:5279 length:1596 start_codon:yes stop_codon:yes gene_type:complete
MPPANGRPIDHNQTGKVLLDVQSLSKTFPGQVALDQAAFRLHSGEIHALVGQNGSGKSTFIKLLSGYIRADRGARVDLFGQPVDLWHRDSRCGRIRVVHQDLDLVPSLNAVENLGLGHGYKTGRFGRIRWRKEIAEAQRLLSEFGVTPNVREAVGLLTAAEQAAVAIVRATRRLGGQGILILDEPTASLNRGEVNALFQAIRQAADAGVGIIFVSHILDEVLNLADRVTILRDGRVVTTGIPVAGMSEQELVHEIVGDVVDDRRQPKVTVKQGVHRLEIENLVGITLRGVSLKVRAGEVLGVGGLVGSGREEITGAIFGATPRFLGKVLVDKTKVFATPHESIKAGMAYIPEDRKGLGMLPRHRAYEHVTLPHLGPLQKRTRLRRRLELEDACEWLNRVDLDPLDPFRRMEKFSGGNQQKAVLARWMRTDPKILLFSDPTQGVDVGAKALVHRLIEEAAGSGVSIVVASSDVEELVRLCDRVLVLRGGMIVSELSDSRLTVDRLMAEITGTQNRRRGMRVAERLSEQVVLR